MRYYGTSFSWYEWLKFYDSNNNFVDGAYVLTETNSAPSSSFHVILLLRHFKQDQIETYGSYTISKIYHYHTDIAFLTQWSIDATAGPTDYEIYAADITRPMADNS